MNNVAFCCLLLFLSLIFPRASSTTPVSAHTVQVSAHTVQVPAPPANDKTGADTSLRLKIVSRYGHSSPELEQAWSLLLSMGYKMEDRFFLKPAHMLILRPSFTPFHSYYTGNHRAEIRSILPAWDLFMGQKKHFAGKRKFESDLAGLSAEVLSQYANVFQQKVAHALSEKEDSAFKKRSIHFLELLIDLDKVLEVEPDLSGGKWMADSPKEATQPHLIKNNYLPKWDLLFQYAASCLRAHKKYDERAISSRLKGLKPTKQSRPFSVQTTLSIEDEVLSSIYLKYKDISLGLD